MKSTMATIIILFAVAAYPTSAASPLSKVVQMLKGMKQKGIDEMQTEKVQFAAYAQWCESEKQSKQKDISLAVDQIALFKADIASQEAAATQLDEKAKQLTGDVDKWSKDLENTTEIRKTEEAAFKALRQEYTESIDAVSAAVAELKKDRSANASKAVSLLSSSMRVSTAASQRVSRFLAQYSTFEHASDAYRAANGSAPTSAGIVEMLNKLHDKFVDERNEAEKLETSKANSFELFQANLKTSISHASEDVDEKQQQKAQALKVAADKKAALADTLSTKTEDDKYLADVVAACRTKDFDFKERSKLRTEELQVLAKAIEVLSTTTIAATEGRISLLQKATTALAMLRSGPSKEQELTVKYLNSMAKKFDSRLLSALAVRTRQDPLAKVREMIKNTLTRLESEDGEEQDHADWCKSEMSANEKARGDRSVDVERLTIEIDAAGTEAAKLASGIVELQQELVENAKSLAERTQARAQEKKENAVTVKDAKDAQDALVSGVTVLREYYDRLGQSTALLQRNSRSFSSQPSIFDGPYTGSKDASTAVIDLLEVIQADYSRLETTTSAEEAAAQQEFETMITEAKALKEQQEKDVEHNTRRKNELEQSEVSMKGELISAQKELDAALAYYGKLKDSCLASGSRAKERAARRLEEIESLKEAHKMLGEEASTSA